MTDAMSETVKQCLNCEYELRPDDRFCPNCGQEAKDLGGSFKVFFTHFLNDYFTFDSKIVRSIRPLMFTPGQLTNDFLAGKRVRYIPPLRLYIFTSIIFFLALSMKGHDTSELNEEAIFWNRFFEVHLPRLFFLLLPLFALLLHLLAARKKGNSYIRHFVFSLHFHVFIFLLALIFLAVSELMVRLGAGVVNPWLGLGLVVLTFIYLFKAMKSVYRLSTAKTTLRMVLLLVLYGFVLSALLLLALLLLYSS